MLIKWLFCVIGALVLMAFAMEQTWAQQRNRSPKKEIKAPKVGEMAPTFKLKSLNGQEEFDLEQYRGKKPVVLFFGSYT